MAVRVNLHPDASRPRFRHYGATVWRWFRNNWMWMLVALALSAIGGKVVSWASSRAVRKAAAANEAQSTQVLRCEACPESVRDLCVRQNWRVDFIEEECLRPLIRKAREGEGDVSTP